MKRNALSCRNYIIETLLWATIAFIWYQKMFFTNIEGKTVGGSNMILVVIIIVVLAVNIIFTFSWDRTNGSIIASVIIPYGIYTYITYVKYISKVYRAILWVTVVVCVLVLIYIFFVKLHVNNKKRRVCRKTKMAYATFRLVGAIASVSLLACLFCNVYIDGTLISPKEKPVTSYGEEYTIAANMDTILLLQEEEWQNLSLEERMDVLQCICNIEGNYLGLNRGIYIYASKLDENTLGYYSDSASSIKISVDLVESGDPYETLGAVCHEMYHAGQARYVEIFEGLDEDAQRSYFLYDASVYAEEFHNYKNARTADDVSEYMEYYGQRCEESARAYSYEAVSDYYSRINEYLYLNSHNSDE